MGFQDSAGNAEDESGEDVGAGRELGRTSGEAESSRGRRMHVSDSQRRTTPREQQEEGQQ
jgi:hypothetical protein